MESHVNKRVCRIESTIMKVEAAAFWYNQALMGNKESSLPGLNLSSHKLTFQLISSTISYVTLTLYLYSLFVNAIVL